MTLHRKDFEAIVSAAHMTINMIRREIREARTNGEEQSVAEHVAQAQGYAEAMRDFANEVAVRHNASFDTARFYRACALDENGFFVLEQDDD